MTEENYGKLYLVSTPIGNLEDITLRALRVLKEVDCIAAEDTRHTRQLLSHFDIHTRLISYHAFNEHRRTAELLEMIKSGQSVHPFPMRGLPPLPIRDFCWCGKRWHKGSSRSSSPVFLR